MSRFKTLSIKEIESLGAKAALEGKSIEYDPFRNIELKDKDTLKRNNAWFKGYKSIKNKK